MPGPTIISTPVPIASAAKILRFDGPPAAIVSVGIATGVVGRRVVGRRPTAAAGPLGAAEGCGPGGGGGGGFDTVAPCWCGTGGCQRLQGCHRAHDRVVHLRRDAGAGCRGRHDAPCRSDRSPSTAPSRSRRSSTATTAACSSSGSRRRRSARRSATTSTWPRPTARCRAAGVLRGIHFSDVPPGQAKYVTCVAGAVLDVVVDIRVGSPTFGQLGQRPARRRRPPRDLPRRGARPRLHVAGRRLDGRVPLLDRLRPRPRARHPPARSGDRHRLADDGARRLADRRRSCRRRTPLAPSLASRATATLPVSWQSRRPRPARRRSHDRDVAGAASSTAAGRGPCGGRASAGAHRWLLGLRRRRPLVAVRG